MLARNILAKQGRRPLSAIARQPMPLRAVAHYLKQRNTDSSASARPYYRGASDEIDILFVICAGGGLIALLTALFIQSLPVALIGLGMVLLATLIAIVYAPL
ncbi:hypothetical protein Q5H93_11185 [Hymenobacter sp. ASUV-10]|uniref:Uncharacterized protein n=1 Tax=Hymenobacter aranciens TaxID=3063996 RepID=A0ABT9BAN3_9BACT|nr:hypothetical protein [Hymenobacter sp. ASUV-10]MDO7875298.1 hypothetical protein [Hymenobacter sp. ASUV-10]